MGEHGLRVVKCQFANLAIGKCAIKAWKRIGHQCFHSLGWRIYTCCEGAHVRLHAANGSRSPVNFMISLNLMCPASLDPNTYSQTLFLEPKEGQLTVCWPARMV